MKRLFILLLVLLCLLCSCVQQPEESSEPHTESLTSLPDDSLPLLQSESVAEPPEPVSETSVLEIGEVDFSGSFATDYECACKLVADFTVKSTSKLDVTVTVSVKLQCIQIAASERVNLGTVTIGDKKFTFSTPTLENYEQKAVTFDFVTQSRTLTRNGDGEAEFELGAGWPFRGTYSGIQIGNMEVKGVIKIDADGNVTAEQYNEA